MKLEKEDFYLNEDGKMVFTKEYHLKRGKCCGNGCVNCPYDWENVKEPKKNEFKKTKRV